jgi:hypothetical protein
LREADVARNLGRGKELLVERDVEQDFRAEVRSFKDSVRQGLAHAHCLLNGKWLISHLAAVKTRRSSSTCRNEWIQHAITQGGLDEVKNWWTRTFGRNP